MSRGDDETSLTRIRIPFVDSMEWIRLLSGDADVRMLLGLYRTMEATELLSELRSSVPWRQDKISLYGREVPLPRLQAWYGDPGTTYKWSGIRMEPLPWTPLLLQIKTWVERATRATFNSVLLNLYRNGNDSVSWHSDDEPEIVESSVIAALSLGAERDFQLRRTAGPGPAITVPLFHGSLLYMAGPTQAHWQHCVPKRRRVTTDRISLTFRSVRRSDAA